MCDTLHSETESSPITIQTRNRIHVRYDSFSIKKILINMEASGNRGTQGTINGRGVRFWGWRIIKIMSPTRSTLRRHARKMAQALCRASASNPHISSALIQKKMTMIARTAHETMDAVLSLGSLGFSLISLELSRSSCSVVSLVTPNKSS